jgi:pimeloyl-ACP methyl ester carboxylesterase
MSHGAQHALRRSRWPVYLLRALGAILALLLAVILFFTIAARVRESRTRQEAAPSTGRFVQAGDVELFVQEWGPEDGQVILLIHGTAAWSGLWSETATWLAQAGYRCIAIDIPPFGFSERPSTPTYGNADQARRIVALMDALEVERAILLGHSFGGGATLETALSVPERIDALILADVGGLNLHLQPRGEAQRSSAMDWFLGTPILRDPLLATTATNPYFTRTLLRAMILDPADATEEKIKILQAPLVLEGATNTLGDWLQAVLGPQEVSRTSDPVNYQYLKMPALIIWGDSVIPLHEGRYLETILPDAELVTMQGVNHIPHLEDPDRFLEIVLDFLE